MLSLVVNIGEVSAGFGGADTVDVFWNVDGVGNVPVPHSWLESPWVERPWLDAGVDYTRPINVKPLPLFPASGATTSWLEGDWLDSSWLTSVPQGPTWLVSEWLNGPFLFGAETASVSFSTPAVHFGAAVIGVKSRDSVGNYQSGAATESTEVVNSTPTFPAAMTRGSYAGGQQSFTYQESPQLRL